MLMATPRGLGGVVTDRKTTSGTDRRCSGVLSVLVVKAAGCLAYMQRTALWTPVIILRAFRLALCWGQVSLGARRRRGSAAQR
jgi:hypothetical protein